MKKYKLIGAMGVYSVVIINNDTGVPHMHIVNDESGFDCSIELLNSKYMPDTKNILTNKELEYFNNWITQSQIYGHLKINNWEKALFYWQTITKDCGIEIPENRAIPNYNKIKG